MLVYEPPTDERCGSDQLFCYDDRSVYGMLISTKSKERAWEMHSAFFTR